MLILLVVYRIVVKEKKIWWLIGNNIIKFFECIIVIEILICFVEILWIFIDFRLRKGNNKIYFRENRFGKIDMFGIRVVVILLKLVN